MTYMNAELYIKLNKIRFLIVKGYSLKSAREIVNYPKPYNLLRSDIKSVFGCGCREILNHKVVVVTYKDIDFIITENAKKQYCRDYGLNINKWDQGWTEHLSHCLKEGLMSMNKFDYPEKIKSEELIFLLKSNFVVGIKIRVDNVDDHLHDKNRGLEEVLTY